MIIMTFQANTPPEILLTVKEALAMYLEYHGTVTVPDIEESKDGFLITLHIRARPGQIWTVRNSMRPYLQWHTDLKLTSIKEEV